MTIIIIGIILTTVEQLLNRLFKENAMSEITRESLEEELECECNHIHKDALKKASDSMPSEDDLYDVAELFKVFGDSTRTRIISALFSAELCVCDIAKLLNMTKSAVSHQLRILRNSKLVKYRRDGKELFYSLSDDHVIKIYKLALEHVEE